MPLNTSKSPLNKAWIHKTVISSKLTEDSRWGQERSPATSRFSSQFSFVIYSGEKNEDRRIWSYYQSFDIA